MHFFEYFLGWNLKIISSKLKWAPSNLSIAKVCNKIKIPKFGTKMPYLGIFGVKFWKTTVIFKIKKMGFNSHNDI